MTTDDAFFLDFLPGSKSICAMCTKVVETREKSRNQDPHTEALVLDVPVPAASAKNCLTVCKSTVVRWKLTATRK